MAATDAYKIAVAEFVGSQGAVISLHSADPGVTGANEIAGGGYARKLTAWGAGAIQGDGSAKITGTTQQFAVEAGDAALWYGVRAGTVAAPGAFLYGRPLTPGVTINAAGNGLVDVTPTYSYAQT